ncbi:unnamed protein product [Rhizoctonia solani]|uniref:Zn(2)-C6 fungal-type domain-containing protein n=1 Tax=Rhizoctonia solani TaxID=456999 RepID=A0A8H3BYP0_9AGAM|nr:unnamed protein product [Rhizoctonia solani]
MPSTTSRPGPPPTSCLTCRRRRKKCDLSKPHCERCLKGGYECLGYASREPRTKARQEDPSKLTAPRLQPISQAVPAEAARSETLDSATVESSEDQQDSSDTTTNYDSKPSILGAALLYRMNGSTSTTNEDRDTIYPSKDYDRSWPQEQSQLIVYPHSRTRQSPYAGRSFDTTSRAEFSKDDLNEIVRGLSQSIPPSVDATQMMREGYSVHAINGYHSQRTSSWFMPPPAPIRDALIARFKGSKKIVLTLSLGTKLFQALDQDPRGTAVQRYIGWIDNLEQRFTIQIHSNPSINDTADRLMIQLELAFLKFTAVDTSSGYTVLRKALPKLLQLVATNAYLYTEHPSGNLIVLFPRTLRAPWNAAKQFLLYDTAAGLVLGVPPLVEYGHDGGCDIGFHGLDWVHGIPVPLIEIISQINSWRARSRVTPSSDWQELERRVLAWEPHPFVSDGQDSATGSAERFAVQEGWRHVVLIYIYMGQCGVSSHDSRVQASVDRIAQLGKTVADLRIGAHMFTHCVVAGVAARLEKHRIFFHKMLLSFKDTRVWYFQGPPFSEVLYHLWHGVGIGGAPVTWDDYVRSRREVVPV